MLLKPTNSIDSMIAPMLLIYPALHGFFSLDNIATNGIGTRRNTVPRDGRGIGQPQIKAVSATPPTVTASLCSNRCASFGTTLHLSMGDNTFGIRDWMPGDGTAIWNLWQRIEQEDDVKWNPEGSLDVDLFTEGLIRDSYGDGGCFLVATDTSDDCSLVFGTV